jgi:acyl phosphate:glycerol-3-phosphate acyltransferase
MLIAKYGVVIVVAYLLGGISFSYLAGRILKGVDLRELGSGNLGATNTMRQVGIAPGVAVMILDGLKGYLAVMIAQRYVGGSTVAVLAGLAAIFGHSFTPFLKFRGGKGVATSAGVFIRLAPLATGCALLVFLLLMVISRTVSISSLGAATALPLLVYWRQPEAASLQIFALLVTILIWLRHRSNLKRLVRGEEPRFTFTQPGGD